MSTEAFPRIIGLTGKARSGKDTVGQYMQSYLGTDYFRYAFADPLKLAAMELLDISWEHVSGEGPFDREAPLPSFGFSIRHFLQVLGTDCIRKHFGDDFWIKRLARTLSAEERLIITDVRFDNEAEWVRQQGGEVWLVMRPDTYSRAVPPSAEHVSEGGVNFDLISQVILNNGSLDDLRRHVEAILDRRHEVPAGR